MFCYVLLPSLNPLLSFCSSSNLLLLNLILFHAISDLVHYDVLCIVVLLNFYAAFCHFSFNYSPKIVLAY